MTLDDYLSCIRIIMINTTLPANIGSAARAMHTMGLSDLVVVDPKLPIDDSSHAHAAGGIQILQAAQTVDDLATAIQDCQLVFAASSRSRHIPRPVVTPTQAAIITQQFIDTQITANTAAHHNYSQQPSTKPAQIAILFGREDRGLTNEELAFADYHIQIDANPNYPVLNVASAIQVIAGFFYAHFCQLSNNTAQHDNQSTQDTTPQVAQISDISCIHQNSSEFLQLALRQVWDEPAVTQQQMLQLKARLLMLMSELSLVDPNHLRDLPSRLSRLLSRLQLDQKEYQLINAMIAKIDQQLKAKRSDAKK
nr:RNA methyltransferase [Psychrobacter sp. I-STPA10]